MNASKNTTIYLEDLKRQGIAKTEAFKAMTKRAARASAIYGSMTIFVCTAIGFGLTLAVMGIQDFFRGNEIVFAMPVELRTNQVVTVKPIEKAKTVLVENDTLRNKVISNAKDKSLAQKIYDTFSAKGLDGQKAVAVAYAESGMNCEATNANTNGTSDLSVMQVNTVHQDRYKLAELANCDKNIDIAADLVAEQGWGIFSSVNNRTYLRYMDMDLAYKSK
jgi:hypothetical protein